MFSAVTIGAAVHSTNDKCCIDDRHGDLLDGFGKANLAMARANRNLVYIDCPFYRLLAETAADKKKDANPEALDAVAFFQRQIRAAMKALTDEAGDIDAFGKRLEGVMNEDCADVLRPGLSMAPADGAAAPHKRRERCDPALNKAIVDISALTNKRIKYSHAASDRKLEVTNHKIPDTHILIFGALFVNGLLAALMARGGITRPIRAIAATLDKLSRGQMDTEIPAVRRRDEVGMIAKAALSIRDQSQETLRIPQSAAASDDVACADRDREEKAPAATKHAALSDSQRHSLRSQSGTWRRLAAEASAAITQLDGASQGSLSRDYVDASGVIQSPPLNQRFRGQARR